MDPPFYISVISGLVQGLECRRETDLIEQDYDDCYNLYLHCWISADSDGELDKGQ